MRLVAVSRVRNEADIIEAFVRHHVRYFDKLIITDDGSIDGTYEALRSLRAEGLPLELLRDPVVGYEQSRYMTLLLRMAVDQFGADWVAPLDADEFIEPEAGNTLAETLAEHEPTLFSIAWRNFVWSPGDADGPEPNPVVRQRFRLPPSDQLLNKILVPAHLVHGPTQLSQGNHRLTRGGMDLPIEPLPSVQLCHFPIRSVAQYASKVAVGFLQYAALPDWDRRIGFHYIQPFQTLLTGGLDALEQRMPADSRHYSADKTKKLERDRAEAQDAPLRYQGGPLLLPLKRASFLQEILHCAEAIARDRAACRSERNHEDHRSQAAS